MRYPVKLRRDGKFFLVTFPDIPEAITQGKSEEQSLRAAKDALETALDFYFEEGRVVPAPSPLKRGQRFVELPVSVAAKVLLLNEMLRQKVRPAELAKRLHTSPQEVNRLTNIRHTSRIDGIAAAMKALGKSLEVSAASDIAA
ncbi:type II toxin-antitoxin system HicB family antitoxin [Edaphobacter sp.]|uniref:type II toxin-antitoxin system HicB family antitoxin n=1 Tax=Edaphobacter sp. TaxID=1934404 RepID=UPI002DB57162|nr:type II toxin-antitoxin system HicB family antitoxin [Edaphobacter sp.]HEU5339772.1 type II toxin-antitoxin system HicB family antitoxin [Edaphobacter sp.]